MMDKHHTSRQNHTHIIVPRLLQIHYVQLDLKFNRVSKNQNQIRILQIQKEILEMELCRVLASLLYLVQRCQD